MGTDMTCIIADHLQSPWRSNSRVIQGAGRDILPAPRTSVCRSPHVVILSLPFSFLFAGTSIRQGESAFMERTEDAPCEPSISSERQASIREDCCCFAEF